MLYWIDYEHFLVDMIDFFTKDELMSFRYLNVSPYIQHISSNYCNRIAAFIPDENVGWGAPGEVIEVDNDILDEQYYNQLLDGLNTPALDRNTRSLWYQYIIGPLRNHDNVILVCTRREIHFMKTFSRFVKDQFNIDAIDLNKLFSEGKIDGFEIDFTKLKVDTKDLHQAWKRNNLYNRSRTAEGRMKLAKEMSTKEKVKTLKSAGVSYIPTKKKELDRLLIDTWVNDDDEEEE